MIEIIAFAVALIGSTISGIWDLKTTEIPDSVCIAMIIIGLSLYSYLGITTGNFSMLSGSVMYGAMFLIFGLFMYYTGQWGGGDGELLVAIAVLLPSTTLFSTLFPFPITYFFNMVLVGLAYTVVYVLYLIARSSRLRKRIYSSMTKDRKFIGLIFSVLVLIAIMVVDRSLIIEMSVIIGLIAFLILFYMVSKEVEKSFYVRIPASRLKEGDMIGHDIKEINISKTQIRGLTADEVRKIQKIRKHVIIRDGLRFGPVFALTLVATALYGDLFLIFLGA